MIVPYLYATLLYQCLSAVVPGGCVRKTANGTSQLIINTCLCVRWYGGVFLQLEKVP